jgi:CTP synthase (UTP-ammonia lyase)
MINIISPSQDVVNNLKKIDINSAIVITQSPNKIGELDKNKVEVKAIINLNKREESIYSTRG